MTPCRIAALAAALLIGPALLPADGKPSIVRDRDGLLRAIRAVGPGTRIALAPGTYAGGIVLGGLRGTRERPLVIESSDPERPARIQGGATCLHLQSPEHVVLRNLLLEGASGNGLNIDDGGSVETPARHIVLEGLVVRDVGPRGNKDGIKLSGVADFRVERCRVERWGDGGSGIDMVGCRSGTITECAFRHDDPGMANGVQAKGGSREITVRRCRFERAGDRGVNIGGSTGIAYFRPRPEGFEARDIVVEDSTFIGCGAAVAFVGVDGATARHNVIYRPRRWVLRILQENRAPEFVACRNGRFERNIIAFRSAELRAAVNIGPGTLPETFRFAGNVWFALDEPAASRRVTRSLPVAETDGMYGVDPDFVDAEGGRLELRPRSPARCAGPRPIPERPGA